MAYEKQHRIPGLSKTEQERLTELKFYILIYKLFSQYKDVLKITSYIDTLTEIFECNQQVVSQVLLFSLNKNPNFAPGQNELTLLLYKNQTPLRKIAKIMNLSNRILYKLIKAHEKEVFEFPRKLPDHYFEEIKKFMFLFEQLQDITEVW